jgi:hypothetical protein
MLQVLAVGEDPAAGHWVICITGDRLTRLCWLGLLVLRLVCRGVTSTVEYLVHTAEIKVTFCAIGTFPEPRKGARPLAEKIRVHQPL